MTNYDADYIDSKSCTKAQCGCLCGTSSCRLCCHFCPSVFESTSTRLVYLLFFTLNVTVMALMMSSDIQNMVMQMIPDHRIVCEWVGAGSHCEAALGYMAVYRLGFAIVVYHVLLMLIMCGIKSSRDCRAGLHNGMWFYKILLLSFICLGAFLLPDEEDIFIMSWMYTAMAGAAAFIIIQLLLLIFMFEGWTDKISARVEAGGSKCCWYWVVAATIVSAGYVAWGGGVFMLYYYFAAHHGCHRNQWFVVLNAVACIIVSIVAACRKTHKPAILRLLPASLVCVYVMFLTWAAISSAPRKHTEGGQGNNSMAIMEPIPDGVPSHILIFQQDFYCGPDMGGLAWGDLVLPYISVAIMFISVAYASVGSSEPGNCRALQFPSCPSRSAISRHEVEDMGGQRVVRNEKLTLAYSYSLFHGMLALSTLYIMMSLTDWYMPTSASLEAFGRSWSSVWVKISTSWLCLTVYLTVALFPKILPDQRRRNNVPGSHRSSLIADDAAVPLTKAKRDLVALQETTV